MLRVRAGGRARPTWWRRRSRGGAGGLRCDATWVPPRPALAARIDDPALRGRPPDRRGGDRRRGERPGRPLRGRRLVPHAARELLGAPVRAPAPAGAAAGRPPGRGGRPTRTTGWWPSSATCRTCWPTCSPRRRPRACSTRARRCRHVGPSFRDITRVAGANTAIWADMYAANREAIVEEIARVGRLAGAARLSRPARAGGRGLERPAPRRPRAGCWRRTWRRHGSRAAPHRPEPPRYRRPGGAGARQGGGEHRRHGAGAGRGHAHGRDDALDRRRRGRAAPRS